MLIGITGGIACGKSEALKIFQELGFRTVDSDVLVKDIYQNDPEVRQALRDHFGDTVFMPNGDVDLEAIAKIVFDPSNQKTLWWLEDLLHPKVKKLRDEAISRAPQSNWVAEIPLLFEKKLEKDFDIIICLSSSKKAQLERLISKGISQAEAESRIVRQLPLDEKEKRADYLILNNGTKEMLRQQVVSLANLLKKQYS